MKEYSIISLILLAIIFTVFAVLVPKYPDIKHLDLRNKQITEVLNNETEKGLE